jgi:hypothetical protein
MELSVCGPLEGWDGRNVRIAVEEDVAFTRTGCGLIGGRQTGFYLI